MASQALPDAVEQNILPHICAIYSKNDGFLNQTGSGFFVNYHGIPFLITACHCLYGNAEKEEPYDKLIYDGFRDRYLSEFEDAFILKSEDSDLCLVQLKGLNIEKCLGFNSISHELPTSSVLGFTGYLARDFVKSKKILRPKPNTYVSDFIPHHNSEIIKIKYLNKSIYGDNTFTNLSPIPRGISGGLIFNATALLLNRVEIHGILTNEQLDQGFVFGSSISVINAMFKSSMFLEKFNNK